MKSSKLLVRSICGPMMVLFTFFFAMDVSSAADTSTEKRITKQFLTSGQVDLAREIVRLPLHRGRLSSGETVCFVLILQPGFRRGTSFPVALPGSLLVPAAPARPGARGRGVRRSSPDQMPQHASHFGDGERQQIGFEIDRAFFPRPRCSEARRDRRAPASPA